MESVSSSGLYCSKVKTSDGTGHVLVTHSLDGTSYYEGWSACETLMGIGVTGGVGSKEALCITDVSKQTGDGAPQHAESTKQTLLLCFG